MDQSDFAINVATYNIRLGIQEGVDAIADVVRPFALDILALQEVGDHWVMGPEGSTTDRMSELLQMEAVFVPAIEQNGARYGTAFCSTYPISYVDVIELPEELDEPRRLALFHLEVAGRDISVLSTHLSWIEDREAQWPIVLEMFESEATARPTLLLGDLNEEPGHWAIARLREIAIQADPTNALTFPSDKPRAKLDYIFASEGEFEDVAVVHNRTASDHFAVTAKLRLF